MLFLKLLEHMALIALAAYIYSQSYLFRNLMKEQSSFKDKVTMILFFSALAIIGTYIGVNVEPYAFANTRPIGAITAGYIGGPVVGVIVGIISGVHRYSLGGFTAFACGVSTILEGLIGGVVRKYVKGDPLSIRYGFIAGIIAEAFQMCDILILAKPYQNAVALEKVIAIPMILVNTAGVMIFINIIKNARDQYNRTEAIQAQKILNIAKRTINYLERGFNLDTARNVAEIICDIGNVNGVFIGDREGLLVYCAEDVSHETLAVNLQEYYKTPSEQILRFKGIKGELTFYCVPILVGNHFEGVLGLKVRSDKNLDKYFIDFSKELTSLLSTQIAIYKLNKMTQAASTAELRALRAQIRPHFLFNALNTISSFCRTDPGKAKELILNLSNYFRKTLCREEDFVTLNEELELIQSYIAIEKARFGERVKLTLDIPEDLRTMKLPVFILQQIIENSIKHGISPKPSGGEIYVKAVPQSQGVTFLIEDTGIGMSEERLQEVVSQWPGIGLKNANDRLAVFYGKQNQLSIESTFGTGTKVTFFVPR